MTITRSRRNPIMHGVVEHNGTIYIGGLVGRDFSAPMETQAAQALERLEEILHEAGVDKTRVLSTMVFITDMSLKPKMNEAWVAFFGDHAPTRATIGVSNLEPGVLMEFTSIVAR